MVARICKSKMSPPVTGRRRNQANKFLDRVRRHGQYAQKTEQRGNRAKRGGGGARLCNVPGIGDDTIKLADYLRSNVKNDRGGATGFEQRARRRMLRRVIQCVNENVRINEARLNGHRRRCRGGQRGLRCRDARAAIRRCWGERRRVSRPRPQADAKRHFSPSARRGCRRWWRSARDALPALA